MTMPTAGKDSSQGTLSIRAVSVRYASHAGKTLQAPRALDEVSFDVRPGLITALVGPNGSGKSSLVRGLLRRVPFETGSITLDGTNVLAWDTLTLARRIAVVPQREESILPLEVREFVALGRFPHRGAFASLSPTDHTVIERSMQRAGVVDYADRRTDTLSGGEWQRARIARALAQDAAVLVLDEPTTFLDVAHEMAVFELLDTLAHEGRTVLLVSHQLNLVARFAGMMVLLDHGRVAASGSVDEVMRGDVLEGVYRWPLVVTRDPAVGAPALLPLRMGRK